MNKEVANFNNLIQKRVDFIENSLKDIHEHIYPYDESVAILKNIIVNGNVKFTSELPQIGDNDVPVSNLFVKNILSPELNINQNIKLNNDNVNFLMNNIITIENVNINNGLFHLNDNNPNIKNNYIVQINDNFYRIINISNNSVQLNDELLFFSNTKINIYPFYYFSVFNLDNKSIFNIDYLGNFFFNPNKLQTETNRKFNYENKMYVNIPLVINSIELTDNKMIKNMNSEFLNGFKSPMSGELVSTTDNQTLSNKSFNTNIDLMNNQIKNVRIPLEKDEVVNKEYVDNLFNIKIKDYINIDYVANEITNNYRENDIVFYISNSELFEFKNNVLQKIELFQHEQYMLLLTKGPNKGNKYLLYYEANEYKWKSILFSINNVQTKMPIIINNDNKIELNINNDIFGIYNNSLNLKKKSISSDFLNLKNNEIFFLGGLKGAKSFELEKKFEIGLFVDENEFYFGKEGELKLKGVYDNFRNNFRNDKLYLNKSLYLDEDLVIRNGIYIKSFIKPVIKMDIKINKRGAPNENTNKKSIQYFINVIKNNNESIIIQSKEFSEDLNYPHIYCDVEWEYLDNDITGFYLYRKIGLRCERVFISREERNVIDVIIPDGFSKLKWETIDDINEKIANNNTKISINYNHSFFYQNIGIFESHPQHPLHFKLNDKITTGLFIDDKRAKNHTVFKIQSDSNNYKTIELEDTSGNKKSSIGFGNNIVLNTTTANGQIYVSNKLDNKDYNEVVGENLFKMQILDGGLFAEGNIMTLNGFNFQSYNRSYQNAAAIKTGEYGNSVGDSCLFNWNDNNFEIIPIMRGLIDRKNKVRVKNFVIEHPSQKNKLLAHACIEGPTADVFYRGTADFTENQCSQIITLPNYFKDLILYDTITIQLTCLGDFDKVCAEYNKETIQNNYFHIHRKNKNKRQIKVCWEIKATRKSAEFPVEMDKGEYEIGEMGPYCWIGKKK
jgi:hypothetical protein